MSLSIDNYIKSQYFNEMIEYLCKIKQLTEQFDINFVDYEKKYIVSLNFYYSYYMVRLYKILKNHNHLNIFNSVDTCYVYARLEKLYSIKDINFPFKIEMEDETKYYRIDEKFMIFDTIDDYLHDIEYYPNYDRHINAIILEEKHREIFLRKILIMIIISHKVKQKNLKFIPYELWEFIFNEF